MDLTYEFLIKSSALIANNKKYVLIVNLFNKTYKSITVLPVLNLIFLEKTRVLLNLPNCYNYKCAYRYMHYGTSKFYQAHIKITITSKIYRLYINNKHNLIKSHVNYGHIIRTPILFVNAVKQTKYKIIFYGFYFSFLKSSAFKIVLTRPYNIFTARGFRLKPSIVYKKIGKVSAYR